MGVPTSEVGYTPAMPRREDHEVHKDMWGVGEKKIPLSDTVPVRLSNKCLFFIFTFWTTVYKTYVVVLLEK